jgi:hypothetical protein
MNKKQLPKERDNHIEPATEEELFALLKRHNHELIEFHKKISQSEYARPIDAAIASGPDYTKYYSFQKGQKTMHILAEKHTSFRPVEIIHSQLFEDMSTDPESWLILREAWSKKTFSNVTPPHYDSMMMYVSYASSWLNIPVEDALADYTAIETKQRMKEIAGITEREIDLHILATFIDFNGFSALDNLLDFFMGVAKALKKPLSYTMGLANYLDESMIYQREFISIWDQVSKERLPEVYARHPGRNNVIVSVGSRHGEVFR